MALPGVLGVVYLALVPGIGSIAREWLVTMPSFVTMVPVDYRPAAALMNVSANPGDRWGPGRQPGGPGDYIEVMALRLLAASLPHALAGERWAIAGHSSGGTIVYRCMDLIAELLERPATGIRDIAHAAFTWLPTDEAIQLQGLLDKLHAVPLQMPVAAISLEGSLLPCDVDGWAEEFANPNSKAANKLHGFKKARECTLAADIFERCSREHPARLLQSIRRWFELKDGPPFAYMAGTLSTARTQFVFPALEAILNASGAPSSKLEVPMVPHSGHPMNEKNPEGAKQAFARILQGNRNSAVSLYGGSATHTVALLAVMSFVAAGVAAACFRVQMYISGAAKLGSSTYAVRQELGRSHAHPLLQ